MSARANGAYSRRGDDDRYTHPYRSDRSDRRENSYNPRDPRDSRDRPRGGPERSRSPAREMAMNPPPRPVAQTVSGVKRDVQNGTPTNSQLPSNAPNKPTVTLADVLKEWMYWASEKTKLEQQLDLKLTALNLKKADFDRSTAKHSEQASLPEYQNKFRKKYEKEVDSLKRKLAEAKAEFEKVTSALAVNLTRHMPLEIENMIQQLMEQNIKKQAAALGASVGARAVSSDMEERIEALVTKQVQEKTAHFEWKVATLESKITDLEAVTKSQFNLEAAIKNQFKQASENLRKEKGERQADIARQQESIDELSTRSKNLEDQIARLHEEKSVAPINPVLPVDGALKVRFDKFESTQTADRVFQTAKNNDLTDELTKLRVDMDKVTSHVNQLGGSVVYSEDFTSLQSKFQNLKLETEELLTGLSQVQAQSANMKPKLDDCSNTVKTHQAILRRLDVTALDKVADWYTMEWPVMQAAVRTISDLQERVQQIDLAGQEITREVAEIRQFAQDTAMGRPPPTVALPPSLTGNIPHPQLCKLEDKINHYAAMVNALIPKLSGMMNSLQEDKASYTRAIDERMKTLESPPLSATVDLVRSKIEKVEGEFGKLSADVEKIDRRSAYLGHRISDLDTQYQNITSEDLAAKVLHQMEQLYPNNAQIMLNLQSLTQRADVFGTKLNDQAHELGNLTQRIRSPLVANAHDISTAGNKRRRVDEVTNGNRSPVISGQGSGGLSGLRPNTSRP